MHRQLHELLNNPNYLSSNEVYGKLTDNKFKNELSSIFGGVFVTNLLNCRDIRLKGKIVNSLERFPERYGEYTQIYVWGDKASGKTCLLGSLFTAIQNQCKSVKWIADSDTFSRIEGLIYFFRHAQLLDKEGNETSFLRLRDGDNYSPQIYNVECVPKGALQHRPYRLSFIEANTLNSNLLTEQLKSNNHKIHFFCFDCSKSQTDQQTQASRFCQLLKQLKNSLNTAIGLYLIVTKTDTMLHVPEEFRHNAAQTLITANHQKLWQQVVNACYEMNIYDATPIPFSIGDVVLQDIVKPDLKDAISILHHPIFLKAYKRPGLLRRVLWSGGWKSTTITLFLFFCLIVFALYAAFALVSAPPMVKPEAYRFDVDFMTRVNNEIVGHHFNKTKKAYNKLKRELELESNIVLSTGKKLKDVTVACDSCLTNMFADVLAQHYTSIYDNPHWYKISLIEPGEYVERLITKNTLLYSTEDSLRNLKQYYDDLDTLKYMMSLADRCSSWEDVEYISDRLSWFQKYPYENDSTLIDFLYHAEEKSHHSYLKTLENKANSLKQNYIGQYKWGENSYMSQGYFEDIKTRYKRNIYTLIQVIQYAIDNAPLEFQDQYEEAKSNLELTIKKINNDKILF